MILEPLPAWMPADWDNPPVCSACEPHPDHPALHTKYMHVSERGVHRHCVYCPCRRFVPVPDAEQLEVFA